MNFKQFFNLLKQQRLFSSIYVICTALSTALTLTLFLVIYIMVGPVYPEQERSRMAVLHYVRYDSDGGYITNAASLVLADSLRRMPEVECLTAISARGPLIVMGNNDEPVTCLSQQVDDDFWRVFRFRFVQGRAFTPEEVKAHSLVCVVSKDLAREAFGRTDVVGRSLKIDLTDNWYYSNFPDSLLRIVGVVEDASMAMPLSSGHLWVPTQEDFFRQPEYPFSGGSTLAMLLRRDKTMAQLKERVRQLEERTNQEMKAAGSRYQVNLHGSVLPHWQSSFVEDDQENWQPVVRKFLFMLLAFLMIPAMNMSSMVASRINARISEMGIRRAYGASRASLLWQVLQENFVLTLFGSLLGLLISWLIVALGASWLPFIFSSYGRYLADLSESTVQIHADMLFSGWVMAAVLAATLVLNLVSALVPTMWVLNKRVTEEINSKR